MTVQLTIRNVPVQVKKMLSSRAKADSKSLNTVLVEALSSSAGISDEISYTDLDHLVGRWSDDPEFDKAILAHDQIDEELWK